MRKTRLICTIGPSTQSLAMLEVLANAGMDIARLNFSHGSQKSHGQVISKIKTLNKTRSKPVAIMLDTQGPEIRTAQQEASLRLQAGQTLYVYVEKSKAMHTPFIVVEYADLLPSLQCGDNLSLDNGLFNLRVKEKHADYLVCTVEDGGELAGRRHVNLPGVHVNLPAITAKDHADILFAIEQDLDFIALSFVRNAQAIIELRHILHSKQSQIQIIAKIENQEGLDNLEEIIAQSDAVMVARGDLGIEIAIECLPNVQQRIVKLCAIAGKPVIIATHMLESMISAPIPTRAEVSDVANAVYQQADAVMLSGETSIGQYAEKSVQMLAKIAREAEQHDSLYFAKDYAATTLREQLASSAVALQSRAQAKGILVISKHGTMARFIASAKPQTGQIFVFTFSEQVQRRLALCRAVKAFVCVSSENAEAVVLQAIAQLKQENYVTAGEHLVVVSDFLTDGHFDAIQLRHIQ